MQHVGNIDTQLRQAAFDQVNWLAAIPGGILDSDDLAAGFQFAGHCVPLINPQRGIFKPAHMNGLLSIRTVFPRKGVKVWYDDQRDAHRQIYAGDDVVEYAFMGADPQSPDNRWLHAAMVEQTPIIYFLGASPGRYQPIIPTFIVGWHPERLRVQLAFGVIAGAVMEAVPPTAPERRYALREVKVRLHQASFREAVLAAYGGGASASFASSGIDVSATAVAETRAAMQSGVPVIVQAALAHQGWNGRADILRRVEVPSGLGGWSYEPIDTKLARETKAGTVLQLCLYADLLTEAQHLPPENMYVVAPWSDFVPQHYRFADYAAYFRKVKRALAAAMAAPATDDAYPDPIAHCDICRWREACDEPRRDSGHTRGAGASARPRCRPSSTHFLWQRRNSWPHNDRRQPRDTEQPILSVRPNLS